jgi:hypothetical protein
VCEDIVGARAQCQKQLEQLNKDKTTLLATLKTCT